MIDLDDTANKSRLGANATVGVSMALARALAASAGVPLWRWLTPPGVTPSLPVPHFNVLNGGVHAPNSLDFQEFMIAPVGAPSLTEAVRAGVEVYARLRRELSGRKLSTGLGDEGGFAPEIAEPEEVLRLLVQAISDAGYRAGSDGVSIALDPAASEFRQPDGRYRVAGDLLDTVDMIERFALITRQFPVHLIEDGLGADDDDGWIALTSSLGRTTERLPSFRRDRGPLHCGSGRGHRLRAPEIRRPGSRGTRGQVQPAAGNRRRHARPPLRHDGKLTTYAGRAGGRGLLRSSPGADP
jgi:enolase